jgi:hypothetical protein
MYANDRGRAASISTAIGRSGDGMPRRLSLRVIAGTDDPLLAETGVAMAIARGRSEALCRAIARRVRTPEVVAVEVVRERIDTIAMAKGDEHFGQLTAVATCSVP